MGVTCIAVLFTDSEDNVPDDREVLACVQPVPVVKVSQLKVVVSASIARVRLPSGTVKPFHLVVAEAPEIVPEQVRFPLLPSKVQPVSAEPPDKRIEEAPLPVGPIFMVVTAPPKFKVVTVALSRLNVVAEEVRSPPLIAKSPAVVIFPTAFTENLEVGETPL